MEERAAAASSGRINAWTQTAPRPGAKPGTAPLQIVLATSNPASVKDWCGIGRWDLIMSTAPSSPAAPAKVVPPMEAAIERFLRNYGTEAGHSEHTLRAYRSDLTQFRSFLGPQFDLTTLDRASVEAWFERLAGLGLKPATRRRKLAVVRRFVAFCEREHILAAGTLSGLELRIPLGRSLPRSLSDADARAIMEAATRRVDHAAKCAKGSILHTLARRDRALLELLLATGLRIGEAVRLRLADLDLSARRILVFGKGGRERTGFLVDNTALSSLSAYLRDRRTLGAKHDALFIDRSLRPMATHVAAHALRTLASDAEISGVFTPHMLRHTAATLLLRSGADIRIVQEFLGHASITMTQRYTHVTPQHLERSLRTHRHMATLRRRHSR
jgi:site-specific recombinase XerD